MPLTNAQIVQEAMYRAKAPAGYTTSSGRCFNLVLDDLCYKRDLAVNLIQETLTIPANTNGPITGAADYLRTYDFFYTINGVVYFMNPVDLARFDAEFKQPQLANYPYEFAVDSSPQASQGAQQIYIYPMSNQTLSATHRYFRKQPQYTSPESDSVTVPWFQDQTYLITATAAKIMEITDDTRLAEFEARAAAQLKPYLIMEGDKENRVSRVRLDPLMFKQGRSLTPTKVTG